LKRNILSQLPPASVPERSADGKPSPNETSKGDQEPLPPTTASSQVTPTVPTGLTDNGKSAKEKRTGTPENNSHGTEDVNGSESNIPNGRSSPEPMAHDPDSQRKDGDQSLLAHLLTSMTRSAQTMYFFAGWFITPTFAPWLTTQKPVESHRTL